MVYGILIASRYVTAIEVTHNEPHNVIDTGYLIVPASQRMVSVII